MTQRTAAFGAPANRNDAVSKNVWCATQSAAYQSLGIFGSNSLLIEICSEFQGRFGPDLILPAAEFRHSRALGGAKMSREFKTPQQGIFSAAAGNFEAIGRDFVFARVPAVPSFEIDNPDL